MSCLRSDLLCGLQVLLAASSHGVYCNRPHGAGPGSTTAHSRQGLCPKRVAEGAAGEATIYTFHWGTGVTAPRCDVMASRCDVTASARGARRGGGRHGHPRGALHPDISVAVCQMGRKNCLDQLAPNFPPIHRII